jgi:tetratricopeptide (TPR) repeat protein
MFEKLYPTLLMILFLFGCAAQPPVRKPPVTEPPPEIPQVIPEPIVKRDPFQALPEKIRLKALELEKNGEFPKALFYWKVVHRFEPHNRAASEKMKALETHIRREAERHFSKGVERFQKNLMREARREFLLCLAYQPEHVQALDYLKHKLYEPDSLAYETREGDTLKKISQEIYQDAEKDFLIAYFNNLEHRDSLKSGLTLKLPVITSIGATKKSYSEERVYKRHVLPKPQKPEVQLQEQAEVHYAKGIRHFLAEELDQAIVEWEETLRLNPEHSKAKRDLEKARRLLKNFKRLP